MKAAIFYGGTDIRVEDVMTPIPSEGEVLIDVGAAGICGSDLHYYRGADPWGSASPGPRRAGHELAGVVVETGFGVSNIRVGDRVAVEPMHLVGCGHCRQCCRGDYHICPSRGIRRGQRCHSAGFSEFDIAIAENVFVLPDDLSFESASMVDVYACALHAINRIPVEMLGTIAIIGTGPVGMSLGQVACAAGARKTIMIGRREELLGLALDVRAADAVIDSSKVSDLVEAVRELTDGEGADVVFESVGGNEQTLEQAVDAVTYGGIIGILGAFWKDVCVAYRKGNRKEIDLRWCNSYSTWRGVREYETALGLVASGRVLVEKLITHCYRLDRIGDAFGAAADKASSGAIKVVVQP